MSIAWEKKTLKELVELQRGHDLPSQNRESGDVPVMGGGGINGFHSRANVKGPGVVIGRSGAGFGTAFFSDQDFWAHNTVLFAKGFKGNHPKYVFHFLDSLDFSKYNSGGAQPSLNRNFIYPIEIEIPPRNEQEEIARILDCWTLAIEKTERLIAAKERWFKGLVEKLILPFGPTDKRLKHSRICDIADRVQRRSDGGAHPILSISSASGFVLQEEKYSRYMAGKSVENYILLRCGEFAYNKGNSLRFQFGCVFELKDFTEALVPHVYVCFKPRKGINTDYLGHLFAANYLRRQLGTLVKTGVRNNGLLNIRPDEFLNTTVPIPSLDQQNKIAETLNAAKSEFELMKKELEALRKQKRGLMQKLLTGQWRVNA